MSLRPFKRRAVTGDPLDVAAHWVTREDEGRLSPEDAADRDAWLEADPRHREAYERTGRAMGRLEGVAADPRILALRDAALSLRAEPAAPRWRMAAALAAAVVLAGGGWLAVSPERPAAPAMVARLIPFLSPNAATYRTAVGERSTVTLPDGSVATLNTDTVLKVAFTGKVRGVRLLRGQALFEVAHARARPFEVYAGGRTITAVGTVFDVRLDGEAVKVSLVEGIVRVRRGEPSAEPAPQVTMTAGEVLEAWPAEPMVVRSRDVERETSWRSGVVVFDETPLAEAAAELNRYSTDQLVIADPSVGRMHVTGVFRTGDLRRFARTVEEILPVSVEAAQSGNTVLARRPESISPAG